MQQNHQVQPPPQQQPQHVSVSVSVNCSNHSDLKVQRNMTACRLSPVCVRVSVCGPRGRPYLHQHDEAHEEGKKADT